MKKIKTYGLLTTGAALLATGIFGLSKVNELSWKFNKNKNVITGIAGALALLGAALSAYVLDKELRPEDEVEEVEAVSE